MTPRSFFVRSWRIAYNSVLDIRSGMLLHGDSRRLNDESPTRHASDYAVLARLFENQVAPSDVLVDVGCGRGRVIQWWLRQGLTNRMIGLEQDQRIAALARRHFRRTSQVTIIEGDALINLPEDGTVFYLFNPFEAETLGRLKTRLEELGRARGRVKLIYYNCEFVHLFLNDPLWKVVFVDLGGGRHAPYSVAACIDYRASPLTVETSP
jgi:hypothetical protein